LSDKHEIEEWDNSTRQKIWILMQVWAEARFNFVYFDQVPELDWDEEARNAIPKILASENIVQYYQILQELVALLNDGHTFIMPPMEEMESLGHPALETQMTEDKIVITRIGDSEEIIGQKITLGLEVIEIDGVPAKAYLNDNIMRYYSGGTRHWGEAFGLSRLLEGPKNSIVKLKLRGINGSIKDVEMTRNSKMKNGEDFNYKIYDWHPLVERKTIDDDIIYYRLSTFSFEQIVEDFNKELDQLDLNKTKGMILDIRHNIGGNSDYAFRILSRLIDEPVEAARWRTRKYLPAFRSWGRPEEWHEDSMGIIQPSPEKRYSGPLIILTGHTTVSAAEDFLVPLKSSKRAKIVGDTTSGSTGNPITIQLPGGYLFRVCAKRDTFPDGEEFVGIGIEPDIIVKTTQRDVYDNRDRALERAVEMIRDWDRTVGAHRSLTYADSRFD
jgi:C-terminal processing protease CtpA/Prc